MLCYYELYGAQGEFSAMHVVHHAQPSLLVANLRNIPCLDILYLLTYIPTYLPSLPPFLFLHFLTQSNG